MPVAWEQIRCWARSSGALLLVLLAAGLARAQEPPNVLLIILDDSNDWIGVLGEHPQTRTPRIDALAAEGTLFTSVHAAAALCNPSRTSFMTGISPARSGVRINKAQRWRDYLPEAISLNQAFRSAGYEAVGLGKVYHGGQTNNDRANWDDYRLQPDSASPPASQIPLNGFDEITRGGPGGGDWGVIDAPVEAIEDHIVATWAEEFFAGRSADETRPFFLAVGFRSTHPPWYFTQAYFDAIAGGNTDDVVLPPMLSGDLDDTGPVARRLAAPDTWAPIVGDPSALRIAVHSYLAGLHFMDEQVGRVLDALGAAGHADDTIVVLLSDNGYHLGEKQTLHKQKLWEEATRVPLVVRIPERYLPGTVGRVAIPVSLSAIFPTLLELAGIPLPGYAGDDPLYRIDYRSLVPLLQGDAANWAEAAVTYGPGEDVSIRLAEHRFTLYRDGFQELYERSTDRHEWYNVAGDPAQALLSARLASDAQHYLANEHAPFGVPERCTAPRLDAEGQPGLFAWQDCTAGPRQAWRIRMTGGDSGGPHRYAGGVEAPGGVNNVSPIRLEGDDVVDASIAFDLATDAGDVDGFNFSLPADGDPCLVLHEAPAGAALHIGASRVLSAASVNLRTLAPCGSPAGSGSIGDLAWSDSDRDGIQEAGEAGFAGAAVNLVDCADGRQLASTATGANGRYVFAGLPPGRYRLRFTAPDGYALSPRRAAEGSRDSDPAPSSGLTPCFDQAAGQHRGGVDAGLHASAGNEAVAVTAWNRPHGGVSVTGNVLRYSGSPTGWRRNTISSARLSEVASGDAFEVRWQVRDNPAAATWTTGLGNQAAFTDWRDIEYGIRNSGGVLKVYENGTWQTSGPALAVGDVIAVRVLPGAIEYRHDGRVVHTSVYPERREFYVNASFLSGPNALEVSLQPLP